MKSLSTCLCLLTMMLACANSLYAYQGAGGEKMKKTRKPTPRPSPSNVPRSPTPPPRPAAPAAADLTIRTNPTACAVLINGQPRDNTNQEGFLNISGLKPGNYTVTVRKAGYAEQHKTVTLYSGVNQSISFSLAANPGILNVNMNVPEAQIEISGVGSYNNRVANLQLYPGRYRVIVSKPGFRTTTQEVEILSGRSENLNVSLSRISTEEMLAQVERDFSSRRYSVVITVCQDIIQNQPDNPRANYLLGQSYYNAEAYADSVPYLVKAVTFGERINLPIKHHHRSGLTGLEDALCSGDLTFHQGNLKFAGSCGQSFDIPYNKILVLKPEPHKAARLHVEVYVLNRKNKEEKKDFNFHVYQTGLRKYDPSNPNSIDVVYCPNSNCSAALDALYQLLQQIRR